MESCREKIVGRKQVANLIKTVRLFELRCLTAYECALISLQPVNPIHIMFCLKETAQPLSGSSLAGSFPVKAASGMARPVGSSASSLLCRTAGFSPCLDICTFRATPR